jgi:7-cyano-7-deazaguanine synthase
MTKEALLLSGGMDSSSIAYVKRPDYAININYGQRSAKAERVAAEAVCNSLNIKLIELDIDCSVLGSGDLKGTEALEIGSESDWWPYRNQLLITLAAAKAVELGCTALLIGTVASDGHHRDGTVEFIRLMNELVSYQEGALSIIAPAIGYDALSYIEQNAVPLELLALTHSCHKANLPCCQCRGCYKHQNTMEDLGHYVYDAE